MSLYSSLSLSRHLYSSLSLYLFLVISLYSSPSVYLFRLQSLCFSILAAMFFLLSLYCFLLPSTISWQLLRVPLSEDTTHTVANKSLLLFVARKKQQEKGVSCRVFLV